MEIPGLLWIQPGAESKGILNTTKKRSKIRLLTLSNSKPSLFSLMLAKLQKSQTLYDSFMKDPNR